MSQQKAAEIIRMREHNGESFRKEWEDTVLVIKTMSGVLIFRFPMAFAEAEGLVKSLDGKVMH